MRVFLGRDYARSMARKKKEESEQRAARQLDRDHRREVLLKELQLLREASRREKVAKEAEKDSWQLRQMAENAIEEKERTEMVRKVRASIDTQIEKRRASLYNASAALSRERLCEKSPSKTTK